MKLVLIGIPGAGKSTQGNLLSKQLKIPYLSTGHIFRNIAREKSPMGRYVKEIMRAGLLIPDNKTILIVEEYLSRGEYKKGYILDGFPRTMNQAKKFMNGIDKVIYIDLSIKEALWRIAYRKDSTRDDETVAAKKSLFDTFLKETVPVLKYYEKKGLLITADGSKTVKKVNRQILRSLGKQIVKNRLKEWEQKQKVILAITGLPGSGKTEASQYFKNKKLPVIHFGGAITAYINSKKLKHTEDIHSRVRMEIREKYGMEAMAVLTVDRIKEAFKDNTIVIIDGLRSYEEYAYLREEFKDARVAVLSLWTDKKTRYSRLNKRRDRKGHGGEKRDVNEVIKANLGPTIAIADFMVINVGSLEEMHGKLESIYREIYFS